MNRNRHSDELNQLYATMGEHMRRHIAKRTHDGRDLLQRLRALLGELGVPAKEIDRMTEILRKRGIG
jgi:tRNA C32,U32 (ribose-2'-O)-methylase TrmJ